MEDCSFILLHDDCPVAICPLFLECQDNRNALTCAGGFHSGPLVHNRISSRAEREAEAACFDLIDETARTHGAVKSMIYFDPILANNRFNTSIRYGFIDASLYSSVVDLSLPLQRLWANLRKSYKSLINKCKKTLEIVIVDADHPDRETHETYRRLHHKTAGRVTRPIETFDLQFAALKEDHASLIGIVEKGCFVALSYFFHHQDSVYFASASDDPDYSGDIPLEHCILWTAMDYYHRRGQRFLEVGLQQFSAGLFDQPSDKEIRIAFFKRGFGGSPFHLFRGVKYYDKNVMRSELEGNVEKLLGAYPAF